MLNARVGMNADDFSEIVKNTVIQVALIPNIHIRSEEAAYYNPEMSMNRPA